MSSSTVRFYEIIILTTLVMSATSCIGVYKLVTGMNNPQVESNASIKEAEIALNDVDSNIIDLKFISPKSDDEIREIVFLGGSEPIMYDAKGRIMCSKEVQSCVIEEYNPYYDVPDLFEMCYDDLPICRCDKSD